MSQITNIVLAGNNGRTQSYIIKMIDNPEARDFKYARTSWSDIDPQHIIIFPADQDSYMCNIKNDWYVSEDIPESFILKEFPRKTLRLYFPDYSADTYEKGCQYILTAYTVVAGTKIELGSFLFRRNDSLACAGTEFGSSEKYYEYIDFNIASPFDIQNNDEAAGLRVACGKRKPNLNVTLESSDEENLDVTLESSELNDISSELFLTLQVVENIGEHYIKKVGWTNGQNSIQIVDYQDLKLSLFFNKEFGSLDYKVLFNGKVDKNLENYIKQTYDVDNFDAKLECVVMDENDVYIVVNKWISELNISESEEEESKNNPMGIKEYLNMFHEQLIEYKEYKDFWNSYKEGVWIKGSISFVNTNTEAYPEYKTEDYESFVTVFSNSIPVMQDVYARMNYFDDEDIKKVNFDELDMECKNITVINQTVQNITTVTPNDSTKSHIIQPIFYQTRNIGKVMIHPEVTENICINLDTYKSNVETFSIKIENGVFNEIGRTSKGIVFKVIGNDLQNQIKEGNLYVLDQDGLLVTTGKYIYV